MALPNNYEMARIEQTDIWFSTIRLRTTSFQISTCSECRVLIPVREMTSITGRCIKHQAQMDPFLNYHRRANNPSIASKYANLFA